MPCTRRTFCSKHEQTKCFRTIHACSRVRHDVLRTKLYLLSAALKCRRFIFRFHFQINCNGAKAQNIQVLAMSPDGRELECPVIESGDAYRTTFQPDEPGEWTIAVKHRGQLIQGSPYTCFVFDPNGIKVRKYKSNRSRSRGGLPD